MNRACAILDPSVFLEFKKEISEKNIPIIAKIFKGKYIYLVIHDKDHVVQGPNIVRNTKFLEKIMVKNTKKLKRIAYLNID